jgi:hypothetical protein
MDLNHGPSGYEPDELPDCSTPRRVFSHYNRKVAWSAIFLKITAWIAPQPRLASYIDRG